MDLFTGPGFLIGLFLGVLIGWVTLWSFLNPLVGRVVARVCAVLAMGFGVNWLVTPFADAMSRVTNAQYESPMGRGGFGVALGWGAGALVFGIAALVLSFLRAGRRTVLPEEENKSPPK